jgi:GH25 family lysozyme M1 (1,4-beta-N-acetylmuramidase)
VPTESAAPTGSAAPAGAASSPAGSPPAAAAGPLAVAAAAKAPRALAGLDVAGFQHPASSRYPAGEAISWTAVAAAGYRFAAVKATEGDYYVNPWAARDLTAAKAAGLDVTPYHFAVPNVSGGAAQAQFAVEYSGYAPGTRVLPLMLDIEYDPYVSTDHTNECYGLTAARMTAWLSAFVAEARSLTGQYPVIYTTANWWGACTGGSTAFGADPMWVAAYGVASPPDPAGWHAYTFWQYTSGGTVPGVASPGTTDLDSFSPAAVGLIDPGSQSSVAGARVSLPVGSLGAAAGETLKYTAGALPPGLSVTAGGAVTGTITAAAAPAKAVTYRVTLSVKNGAGATATAAFSWQVTPAR